MYLFNAHFLRLSYYLSMSYYSVKYGTLYAQVKYGMCTFDLGESVERVRLHVEQARELEVVVILDGGLALPIVVEALQLDGEHRRQTLH